MKSDNLNRIAIPLISRLNQYTISMHSGYGEIKVYFFRNGRNASVKVKAGGVGLLTFSVGIDIMESQIIPYTIEETAKAIEAFLDKEL